MQKIAGCRSISAMAFAIASVPALAQAEPVWITTTGLKPATPVVLHFRRDLQAPASTAPYLVDVSADNRFILYVNGKRVAEGPARGDLAHWRYETVDLRPYLKPGHNVVAAEVWNAVTKTDDNNRFQTAPLAQLSARTGFWLRDHSPSATLDSGASWRVTIQPGHAFTPPFPALIKSFGSTFYAAGSAEEIDGAPQDWNWTGDKETPAAWKDAVPALAQGEASPWTLMANPLPQMSREAIAAGEVVRTDIPSGKAFPKAAITIPANATRTLLIDQGVMRSAYLALSVSKGRGATITVTYSEALYDKEKHKGDRNQVAGHDAIGIEDVFHPAGGKSETYRPLWWRTWRYMKIQVQTATEPLVLDDLKLDETGYPFDAKGYFKSNDADLNKIWDIGWRTVSIDAHETFMDSSYWEQLQYVGDTRIDNIITYTLTGDPRLPIQAIDAYGNSQGADGMIQSAYPSSTDNVIPPFGLLWLGMMHDYVTYQPDLAVIKRNLAGGRKILDWYAPYVMANGLVTMTPKWNYIDWAGDAQMPFAPTEFDRFPSFDRATKTSCLVSLAYLGALKDMTAVEIAAGDPKLAEIDQQKAVAVTDSIRSQCWDEKRGLFADSPAKTVFSQHTNALAVLYDVAPKDRAGQILDKVTKADGIDAPQGVLTASYYFSWYLIKAYQHAGLSDRYLKLVDTWRDLLKLHYTTWPETRGETRSDTHAWSSHPTADLIGVVAGVRPGSPGYGSVEIEPHLGNLTAVEAGAMTPKGLVSVTYKKVSSSGFDITVVKPESLPGRFVWKGQVYPLSATKTVLRLP